jgi:hypothetical protein
MKEKERADEIFADCVDAAKDLSELHFNKTAKQAEKVFSNKDERKAYILGATELYQRVILADFIFVLHQCTKDSIEDIKKKMMRR